MQIIPLTNEEAARSSFTHKVVIPYTDISTKTSATAFTIYPSLDGSATGLPMGFRVASLAYNVATAFVFSPGTLVFSCGDAGDAARYVVASTDLKTAAYGESALTKKPFTLTTAAAIQLTVTAGSGALTSITAGSLELYIEMADLTKIAG